MALTTTNNDLQVKRFLSDFFAEFVRNNRFARYTGTGNNNVVAIKEGRQQISVPLVTRLKGSGVSGNGTLRGNGEALGNYGLTLNPTYFRHAVEHTREELEKPAIDLMKASRDMLMEWSKEKVRDDVINAMNGIFDGTTYSNYGSATAAALDAWNTNQGSLRTLYGNAKSNYTAGDHTGSLANIDTTNDKLDTGIVSLAKRMAQQASPHIRPLKTMEDEDMYVMFCDPYAFRDLKSDSAIQQAQREGLPRNKNDQPLFTGGDLLWDGVIIREIPEIATFIDGDGSGSDIDGVWGANATADGLNVAGDSSSRVGVCFLCGQQALSYGLGQRPQLRIDRDYDYGFQPGVAVELKHDIQKSYFNNVQHGQVSVFVSAAADS